MRAATLSLAALALAGCAIEPGLSGRDAEWARLRAGPFAIVNASYERAVLSANGRQVAVEPAEGFCLVRESIEMSRRSAFVMIGDCVIDGPETSHNGEGELDLPPGVPGVITVTISGDPAFEAGAAAAIQDLRAFLATSEGHKMLGRGSSGGSVRVLEMRRVGDALYVLVEDQDDDVVPIMAPRFWRAFTDLNDRLSVITISGFRDRPLGDDEMLKYLVTQVRTLAWANRSPLDEPITVAALAPRPEPQAEVVILSDARPEPEPEPEPEPRTAAAAPARVAAPGSTPALRPERAAAPAAADDAAFWPAPRRRPDRLASDDVDREGSTDEPSDEELAAIAAGDAGSGDDADAPPAQAGEPAPAATVAPATAARADAPSTADPALAATRNAPTRAPEAPRRPGRR